MLDIIVPAEQEGTKSVVRSWLKQLGDSVAENDALVELETDKVTLEVPAPAAGVLAEILLAADADALPGAVLGRLNPEGKITTAAATTGTAAETKSPAEPASGLAMPAPGPAMPLALSPSVRRAVQEHGIDPATIAGSGRGGRVTREDIDKAAAARAEVPVLAKAAPPPAPAAPASVVKGGTRSVPHDRMRLAIAENMLNSVTVAPHVTAMFEADFSAIMAHQRKHKAAFEKDGVKLTFTAYIIAACVAAMRTVPTVNSRWHADRLETFDDINIGIGAALGDKGLVVPVVQRAQDLSLLGIAGRLGDLIGRARANKLGPGDVRGGTFTISNHGVSGSLLAAPIIINQPQSAALGVGKLEKRVVVREAGGVDAIQVRPMCYVTLSIDHRVIDGHQTNAWLSTFVETIENWSV